MRNILFFLLIITLGSVIFFGCADKGTGPEENKDCYLPLNTDSKWVYDFNTHVQYGSDITETYGVLNVSCTKIQKSALDSSKYYLHAEQKGIIYKQDYVVDRIKDYIIYDTLDLNESFDFTMVISNSGRITAMENDKLLWFYYLRDFNIYEYKGDIYKYQKTDSYSGSMSEMTFKWKTGISKINGSYIHFSNFNTSRYELRGQ